MFINTLSLKNFRNRESTTMLFTHGMNVIAGPNGVGKTSLLESVSILSLTKSFKAKKEMDVIQEGKSFSSVFGQISELSHTADLRIIYEKVSDSRVRKIYQRNDVNKSARYFLGNLYTVLFTTDLVNGYNDKASVRRKFFDQLLSQLDFEYLLSLSALEKILKNKSKALKMVRVCGDEKLLHYWNEELEKSSLIITRKRKALIEKLLCFFDEESSLTKNLTITYLSPYNKEEAAAASMIASDTKKYTHAEIESGRCLYGPQKDDYEVLFNNRSIRQFGSRGEQKYALGHLLYAISLYIQLKKDTNPVILLDDLHAEMDDKYFSELLEHFISTQSQILITAIDTKPFKKYSGPITVLQPI